MFCCVVSNVKQCLCCYDYDYVFSLAFAGYCFYLMFID